jgi:thioredoxin reductase
MKTACIVGGGPSGLVGAKVLLHTKQFHVTIYEKADRIGGIWALDEDTTGGFLHPDTPTNLSRFTVGFSDLDWNSVNLQPKSVQNHTDHQHVPMFPKAWQVNRYLETYRDKYIPDGIIQLEHHVIKAERCHNPDRPGWKITTQTRQGRQQDETFDYLILATGFFSNPRSIATSIPHLPPTISIPTIHSSQYRQLSDLLPTPTQPPTGKTILIIGGGNSAGETAATIAHHLSHATHTGGDDESHQIIHVTPHPLYALPPYTPLTETCETYVPIDLKLYDLGKRPPGPITAHAGRVTQVVKDGIHRALQAQIGGDQSYLGPGLAIPSGEPRAAVHVALSERYPEFVRSGRVEVLSGRVVAIEPSGAGTACEAVVRGEGGERRVGDIGAIVYATGYSPTGAVGFLPEEVKEKLRYDPGSVRLALILQGWQTMTPSVPELAFLGFYEGPYWPMMEMQARFTAQRWISGEETTDVRPYEEVEKLLDLRRAMGERRLDIPQYWFGDYVGYLEEMSAYLGLTRNDGSFAPREGPASPARYLSSDTDKTQADAIMRDLYDVWRQSTVEGRYVARAAFRALQGNWNIKRTIDSALSGFPSGTLEGQASFHPRSPTRDASGKHFDFEYLYAESGTLVLSNGAAMPARKRYVYRYSEERDELSVWFVKPDSDLEVDYLFHNLVFVRRSESRELGVSVCKADHLCAPDMYWTEYSFPMRGISVHRFESKHTVRGPSKDYVARTTYWRPALGLR